MESTLSLAMGVPFRFAKSPLPGTAVENAGVAAGRSSGDAKMST